MENIFFEFTETGFEEFVRALAVKVFGPGVIAFGDGPDDGREATFSGKVPYPHPETECWNGYGVIQAKCKSKSESTTKNQTWALRELRNELELFATGDTRSPKPEYFVFVTNVDLSSVGRTGGRDKANSLVKEYYGRLPLKDHAIWDGNQLRTYLDSFPDLRRTFSQFLTPSDLIAKSIEQLDSGRSAQHSQVVPISEAVSGSPAIDFLSETQPGTSFLQQRVVTGRIEQLQAQMSQFLSQAGRQLAENLRKALRRLDSDSACSLGQKLLEWVEGDGRHADSAARRGAYLLLAELELQEMDEAHESEYETASAWKMLGLAKSEVDDNLGTDDAARLLSVEARLSYLDGDCSGSIELIAGSDHPSCITARLAILLSERRTREAAEAIRDLSPNDSWADLAVAAHVASGQLGEAEELCNWAKSRENTTVHQRCVLAFGRALFHRALGERQEGESLDPCRMGGEEVLGLRAAISALRPLIQVAQANGRIGTGLERDACELALTCAHLAGGWESARELSQLLATARPVSLAMGRAVAWGYYKPDDELISRLRQERPGCFESLHLVLVLEAGLRRATAALRGAVELASNPLPESAVSRVARLVSHLVEMLSPPVQQEAVDFVAGLVGQDHDCTRYAVARQRFDAGDLEGVDELLGKAADANEFAWRHLAAEQKQRRGDLAGALDDFASLCGFSSEPFLLRRASGLAIELKQWDRAAEFLEQAVRRAPESLDLWHDLAFAQLHRETSEGYLRAADCFEVLKTRRPDEPAYSLNHAQVLAQLGKFEEAVNALHDLCERHEHFLLGFLVRSQVLLALHRPQDAFAFLDAVQTRQRFWDQLDFLRLYMDLGYRAHREEAAQRAFQRILELEQPLPESERSVRAFNKEELLDLFRHQAEWQQNLSELVVRGHCPWTLMALEQSRAIYGNWYQRTRPQIVSERIQDRGRFVTYSTNGFSVQASDRGRPYLERLAVPSRGQTVVADISALITLDRLGMLDRAFQFFGQVVVPAELVVQATRDRIGLQAQQKSEDEEARKICRAIDDGLIALSDGPHHARLDELLDDSASGVYRLFDLLGWLRQRGRLNEDDFHRLVPLSKHRSVDLPPLDDAIRESGVVMRLEMLHFLSGLGILAPVVENLAVRITSPDAASVRQKVRAFEALDEVWNWNHELWTKVQDSPRFSFEASGELDEVDGDEHRSAVQTTIAAASLASRRGLPLLADDRWSQMYVLNAEPRSARVAIGTDLLLEQMCDAKQISLDELADAYVQLIDWRYRFLLPPAEVLRVLALRHRRSAPGNPLEKVAIYMHDCITDPGLYYGAEPTEPKTSLAACLAMRWARLASEFVALLWEATDFDNVQATAFTNWALTELMPTAPPGLGLSEQFNFVSGIEELVLWRILISRATVPDKTRSDPMMRAVQESLGMGRGKFCKIVAQVSTQYSRWHLDE